MTMEIRQEKSASNRLLSRRSSSEHDKSARRERRRGRGSVRGDGSAAAGETGRDGVPAAKDDGDADGQGRRAQGRSENQRQSSIGRLSIKGLGPSSSDHSDNAGRRRKDGNSADGGSARRRNGRPQLVKLAPSKRDLYRSSSSNELVVDRPSGNDTAAVHDADDDDDDDGSGRTDDNGGDGAVQDEGEEEEDDINVHGNGKAFRNPRSSMHGSKHSIDNPYSVASSHTWTSFADTSFGDNSFGSFGSFGDMEDHPHGTGCDDPPQDAPPADPNNRSVAARPVSVETSKQRRSSSRRRRRATSESGGGSSDHDKTELASKSKESDILTSSVDSPRSGSRRKTASSSRSGDPASSKRRSDSSGRSRQSRSKDALSATSVPQESDTFLGPGGLNMATKAMPFLLSNSNLSKATASTARSSLSGSVAALSQPSADSAASAVPHRRTISREQSELWLQLVPERQTDDEHASIGRQQQSDQFAPRQASAQTSHHRRSEQRLPSRSRSSSHENHLLVHDTHASSARTKKRPPRGGDGLSKSLHSSRDSPHRNKSLSADTSNKNKNQRPSSFRRNPSSSPRIILTRKTPSETAKISSNAAAKTNEKDHVVDKDAVSRRTALPKKSSSTDTRPSSRRNRSSSPGSAILLSASSHHGTPRHQKLSNDSTDRLSSSARRRTSRMPAKAASARNLMSHNSSKHSRELGKTSSHSSRSRRRAQLQHPRRRSSMDANDTLRQLVAKNDPSSFGLVASTPSTSIKRSNSENSLLDLKGHNAHPQQQHQRSDRRSVLDNPRSSSLTRKARRASMDPLAGPSQDLAYRKTKPEQVSLINVRRQMYALHRSNSDTSLMQKHQEQQQQHTQEQEGQQLKSKSDVSRNELLSLLKVLNQHLAAKPTNDAPSLSEHLEGSQRGTSTVRRSSSRPVPCSNGKQQQPSASVMEEIQEHVETSLLKLEAKATTPNCRQRMKSCRETSMKNLQKYRKRLERELLNSHLFHFIKHGRQPKVENMAVSQATTTVAPPSTSKMSLERFVNMMEKSQREYRSSLRSEHTSLDGTHLVSTTSSATGDDKAAAESETGGQYDSDINEEVFAGKDDEHIALVDDSDDRLEDRHGASQTSFGSSYFSYDYEESEHDQESVSLYLHGDQFVATSPSRTNRSSVRTESTKDFLEPLPEDHPEMESTTLTLSLDVMQRPIEPQDLDDDRVMVNNMEWIDEDTGVRVRFTGMLSEASERPFGHGRIEYLSNDEDSINAESHKRAVRWYKGQFVHGKRNGFGECCYANGEMYKGFFENDQRHGQGALDYPDGRRFEGRFELDSKLEGTMTYEDGSSYSGAFSRGVRHGPNGTYRFGNSALVYVGEFWKDQIQGEGMLIWPNGGKYVGSWKKGVRHGYGVEYRADGSVMRSGRWESGQLVERDDVEEHDDVIETDEDELTYASVSCV